MPFPSTGAIKLSDIKKSAYVSDSSYFLDKISTKSKENTGSAYSVRLVNSSYYGPSVNVRRSSDNATQDFYSDIDGNLGTEYLAKGTTFESWLGTDNGHVTKMYDQTGNGRHVSQSTNANQPLIGPYHVLQAISSAGRTATRGAYGLFRMSNTYTGPTIKFRRSSDNAVSDFYANASGSLGTSINATGTTFSTWAASSTIYVDTWYDQSGNGFHCTQTTIGSQPLYNQTVGVIDFNTDKWMNMGSTTGPFPTGSNPSYSFIFKHGDVSLPSPNYSVAFASGGTSTNNSNNLGISKTNDGTAYSNFWYSNDQNFGQFRTGNIIAAKHDGTTQTTYVNNIQQNTATRTGLNVSVAQQLLGRDARGTSTAYNSQMYYLYVMNTTVSDSDRIILSQYEPQYGFQSNVYSPFKYNISYNGTSSLTIDPATVGCEYPPPNTISSNTTNVTGQTYGNGTYICSASSTFSGNNYWNAFGSTSGWWESAGNYALDSGNNNAVYSTSTTNLGTITGDWVQIQMPTSISVKTFSFGSNTASGTVRAPRRFVLLGSTNGSTWTGISYHSGITTWRSDGRPQYFVTNIDNTTTYNYFRLVVIEMGNSYSGSGILAGQNVTDVSALKFNPATPLTQGSMAYTMLAQCNSQYDLFGVVCEQNIGNNAGFLNHNRSSIIIARQSEHHFTYFSGESNDCTINKAGGCYTNRNIVMVCNHSLVGGTTYNIDLYENGSYFKALSNNNPANMNVAVGGFYIGRKSNNSEYFYGFINEVIVINNMLTPREAYLYSAPAENYSIKNRIMPKLKPKHMIQFESQITNGIPHNPFLQCSARQLTLVKQDTPISTWGDFSQTTYANRPFFRKEGKFNTPYGSLLNDQPFVVFDSANPNFMNAGSRTINVASNGGFTAIACIKIISVTGDTRIFDFGNGQGNDNIILGFNNSQMYFFMFNGATAYSIVHGYRPPNNTWCVVTVRYTASDNSAVMYFNGIQWTNGTFASITNKTLSNCYIAKSHWSSDTYPNFHMSGLYVYDRSLSDTEIGSITNYLLQSNSYGIPKSITTNHDNVSIIGKALSRPVVPASHLQGISTSNPRSVFSNCMQFMARYTDGLIVDDIPGIPLSISFWVYAEAPNPGYETFCSLTEYGRTTPLMQLDWDRNNSRLSLNFAVPNYWSTYYYTVSVDTWYHFVVTFDSNYQVKYYINGTLQNTLNGTGFDAGKGKSRLCFGTNGDYFIRGFYGKMADARIYDLVLRQDEITTIYGNSNNNYINNSQVSQYNTPSQYLCNKTNWKSVMTFQQYGSYPGAIGDPAPYDFSFLADYTVSPTYNQYYNNTAIQNYDSFTLSFDLWTAIVNGDGLFIYIGGGHPGANRYTNYGSSENAYIINFQAYTGNSNFPCGVYLLNNNANTDSARNHAQLAYSPETQWRDLERFIPVTIKYNRSTTNTWTINVNGKDIIRYDDPNILTWAASSGSFWGLGAYNGGVTMSTVIRAVELSYIPSNSNVSASSLIPRSKGFSSIRNTCAPGLLPGFTWKFYDMTTNSANILALPRTSLTSNTTTIVGSTTELLTNGSFVGNTNVSQYNAGGSFGSNTIITLANPGDSPYVLAQTGSAEYEMTWTPQLSANTTYTMSGWYSKSNDYNGTDAMFHSRAHSNSGAHISTGIDLGTILETRIVNGLTWYFVSTTITTPTDYTYYAWFLGYGGDGTTGYRYFTKLSLTRATTATSGTHYDGNYTVTSSNTHSHPQMGDRYVAFTSTNGSLGNIWSPGAQHDVNTGVYTGSVSTTVSGVTQSGEWLQIQLPNPIVLYSFSLNFWWPDQAYWAKSFLIAASNDNSTWTNIYDTTTASFTYGSAQTFVTTGQPIPYRYFRLIVRATSGIFGCDWWILDQWILNAVPLESIQYRAIGRTTDTSSLYQLTNGHVPVSSADASHCAFAEGWFLANQTGNWTFTSTNAGGYSHIYINGNLLTTGSGTTYAMTSGTYYRINIYYGKTSQEYPPSALTAATTTLSSQVYGNGTYIASASSELSSGVPSWRAFNKSNEFLDGYASDCWHSANQNGSISASTPQWIQIQLPTPITLANYSITSRNTTDGTNIWYPRIWRLQGSNNGSSWVDLESNRTEDWSANETRQYTPTSNTTTYSYFRLRVESSRYSLNDARNDNSYVCISELRLYVAGSGTFTFTPPGGSAISNWSGYIFSSTGTNTSFPAESAKVIKDITNTNTDGVYYIRLNGISTATYCLMNDCYDGGGWMMLMKTARGTTFGYSANYWTTNNTLNPTATHRVDGDAKYDAFNYGYIKDVMAIWPDVPSQSYTNVLGKNGGSLNLQEGWCWKVDNWIGNYKTTALSGFQTSRDVIASPNPYWYPGWSSSIWSHQGAAYRHVFGGGSHLGANRAVRWGFLWNNEEGFTSIDAFGGIGMDNTNYSGGDWYGCCGTVGLNRSMRVEVYGR